MSLAPVILPFTHWPVAYTNNAHTPPEIPTPQTPGAREFIAAASRMPSDTVLTCATGFSRGVVLGLASGAIEILAWDESDAVVGLTSLSTTAGHRRSPVVALRRIAAKDTEGRSELLVSAAENGEILKHSLPSGRVLKSTTVPFRPNGVIPVDTYLIVYGRSTEIRILHQNTLEPHIIMAGVLKTWPIPFPLFAERIVTLTKTGDGQHWKLWPDEARMERITSFGAPLSFFHHANSHYQLAEKNKPTARRSRKSRMSRDSIQITLGDPDFGPVTAVHTVGEILWLVVQVNGWCLYQWEEDSFAEVKRQEMTGIAGATSSDAIEDRHRNWFGIWTHTGEILFATIETSRGKLVCNIRMLHASEKPSGVPIISLVFSFTPNHSSPRAMIVTPWVVEPKNIMIELFYFSGEIRYRVLDLQTYEWTPESYPIHRPHHFFTKLRPRTSFEQPPSPPSAVTTPEEPRAERSNLIKSGPPSHITLPQSTLASALGEPARGPTTGPCETGTIFTGMLVFGCGQFVNIYSLPRYLLAFESPERSIEIDEPGAKVSQLSSITTSDGTEYLLIGTTVGTLYILDSRKEELSSRIALFGSPVLFCMSLQSSSNTMVKDMVVVASRDGTVCIVDPAAAKSVFTIPGHFAQIRLLATTRDSNILVVLYEDQCSRLCNLEDGKIENQSDVAIETEEDWEVAYIRVRPTLPENKLIYTDSRYTINGSSTVFVNLYLLFQMILKKQTDAVTDAKAILSALYSWRTFESASVRDSAKIVDLLFLKRESAVERLDKAGASVPAKLGARGISNTLTVFHAHQDLLQISGEITAMVMLVCTAISRVLLSEQLPATELNGEDTENKLVETYHSQFVDVLFSATEALEGTLYKRPWLRGFARFWSSEHAEIRRASRVCLKARIQQLGRRPRELSLTISRWRVLLPGIALPNGARKSMSLAEKRRTSSAGDDGLERVVTADREEFAGHDEVFDDDADTTANMRSDDTCDRTMDESFGLACVILGNISIEFATSVSHAAQKEITGAIEILLIRSDGESLADDSRSTRELQDIAIELVALGWQVWGDDKYLSTNTIVRRIIEFLGADATPMVTNAKTEVELSESERRRHELLHGAVIAVARQSINRVIEICASTITTAVDPAVRIGAVKFMYHVARSMPELLVDRLFPLVDATVATLDPSSTGVRNKVVNSITALFNALVTTFPVVASHRAQQRLALSIRPDLVLVYDLRTGTQMASLEGAKNQCLEINFSPEGRHVMGVDRETGEVYVWKLGHSFLSMIQSIGGGGAVMGHHNGSGARYAAHYNGAAADAAGRDLVYPRFVGKLRQQCALSDLKKFNAAISVSWKQEKVIELSVNGMQQTIDFSHT